MNNKTISKVIEILKLYTQSIHTPIIDLIKIQSNDPFKILIGTILSARTKDKTTAQVLSKLFKQVKNFDDFNNYSVKEIEELIYPIGFYRQKALYLSKIPKVIKDKFNGQIPQTIEELIELPGVGRKTANLVMILAFDKPAMCVDVHVHRISNRLGFIKTNTPYESEMKLREILPVKYWKIYNSILVAFGQNLCKPIKPQCDICPINQYCEKIGV
ncbi:MAG: endonuclease III [Candidatus Cloacimonetes bacterium]|nr:endonuclease III [Candidatus Cloacimonadota bacterium]